METGIIEEKVVSLALEQGCQIFLGTTYQNGKNIPNDHIIYQMTI
jgi:hypothetical protein